ncbi:MAG TPA: hypothetical protein VHK01_18395 [Lacipirellulaceae bacterium]|jgi:hypothetical protein|nr:hypothetical protein [Lacipirellulaceae bacterium]
MYEIWLRPNRRAIWFGSLPPLCLVVLGAWLALSSSDQSAAGWRWVGAALAAIGIGVIAMLLRQLRRPRIAYQNGEVLFYLRSGSPMAVPVNIVEAFFLGQGPVVLPAHIQNKHNTVNLVARLSQREAEWARRQVKPALGNWCDGYVTVRGTWCEPLNGNVIRRLNKRLKEVQTTSEPSA